MGRKNRQRKPEPFKCCETCANMQPIGEGDHICDACCSHDGSPTALVLESYIPADDYFICISIHTLRMEGDNVCYIYDEVII